MIHIKAGPEAMQIIRDALHGEDLVILSVKTGLSLSTLYNLRGGRTKWPREHTLFVVCYYLGLQWYLKKVEKK
jgi:hypothetical protein